MVFATVSRNGSGTYSLPAGNPVITGTTISSTWANSTLTDIATAMTASIANDGQTPILANLPMSTFRHTGVGNGVARTDYSSLAQMQDGQVNWVAAGGTADAITATYSPTVAAFTDGMIRFVRAASANATTTPTFSPDTLTAHTITQLGGQPLSTGSIYGVGHELILRYNLANTRWELLNPASGGILTSFETPSGTIDGSNKTFTLAHTPLANSLLMLKNGGPMIYTTDYTLSGATITTVVAPQVGESLTAWQYRY